MRRGGRGLSGHHPDPGGLPATAGGTYGGQSDLLLLDRYWRPVYASQTALAGRLAVQLREQLLARSWARREEYAYRAAFQEEMGLYAVLQRPQALNRDTRGLLTTVTVSSARCAWASPCL